MPALTNEQFAQQVEELAGNQPSSFSPFAYYDADGDCIEFVWKRDNFRAERVDDRVTVYCSEDTGEMVGSLLKGVSRLIERLPGFTIEIHHGRVKLACVFQARAWSSDLNSERLRIVYRKLIQEATQADLEVEVKNAA